MMIVVNPTSEQEEKVLIAFLDSLKYNYGTDGESITLTTEQQKDLLSRKVDFANGESETLLLDDVLDELERVYR